jgi:hypothetical protein
MKFVFENNGNRIVFTGWRAWLLGLPVILFLSMVGVVIVLLAIGAALTLGTILLFGIPIALVAALIVYLVVPRQPPGNRIR